MTTVIVSGAVANRYGKGGSLWARLQYVLGLKRLGCDVRFVEQIHQANCTDASGAVTSFEDSVQLAYFCSVMDEFGLTGSASLVLGSGEQIWGTALGELEEIAGATDVLLNISGHLTWGRVKEAVRARIYLDQDPAFTQFWHSSGQDVGLEGHDFYFTVGENIGRPGCGIPTDGIDWRATRPPVVIEDWPVSVDGNPDRFTTVASWRGTYGTIEHDGKVYGPRAHEFRKFAALPMLVPQQFEAALEIHPADYKDRQLLEQNGWTIVDPRSVAADPVAFRQYVQSSGAEFAVAQGAYVGTECGWFSDRATRYLASGKPVLVQDTGLRSNYPTGDGLLVFRTLEEAVTGAAAIRRDYPGHCQAARALAEEYFDSDKVLGRMFEEIGVTP